MALSAGSVIWAILGLILVLLVIYGVVTYFRNKKIREQRTMVVTTGPSEVKIP